MDEAGIDLIDRPTTDTQEVTEAPIKSSLRKTVINTLAAKASDTVERASKDPNKIRGIVDEASRRLEPKVSRLSVENLRALVGLCLTGQNNPETINYLTKDIPSVDISTPSNITNELDKQSKKLASSRLGSDGTAALQVLVAAGVSGSGYPDVIRHLTSTVGDLRGLTPQQLVDKMKIAVEKLSAGPLGIDVTENLKALLGTTLVAIR